MERGLDPLKTNLVVADATRTSKTICLAVSPSLKAYGIPGRARLFEVEERVHRINDERLCFSPQGYFTGKSTHDPDLQADDALAVDYIVAPPRMAYYMRYSSRVYKVYLRYFAPEDIHVYSVDEVFIDATNYIATYGKTPYNLARHIVHEVLAETGITATAGIGPNFYLCKVAMDIVAKHMPPDEHGVRVAELDEHTYRSQLWDHRPLTDFWQIGRGISRKLETNGMYTMGDVARRSLDNEDLFYKLFGTRAEFVIDHAWGWEPVEMKHVKSYRPQNRSFSSGQVLSSPYKPAQARVVVREMAHNLALNMVDKRVVTSKLTLTIGYDTESLAQQGTAPRYEGKVVEDYYGREVPYHAHGTTTLPVPTSSSRMIAEAVVSLYDSIVDPALLVRRLTIATDIMPIEHRAHTQPARQLELFADEESEPHSPTEESMDRELRMQQAALSIKKRFGNNAILMGTDFEEGATAKERNRQIGGHKA